MNRQIIVVICAECKKVLRVKGRLDAVSDQTDHTTSCDGRVLFSHSICFDCGTALYGIELMSRIRAKHCQHSSC